jgi:hypothetical protein
MPTTVPAAPTTRQTNPKKRIVAINGSGGAQVLIACSKFCRYVEVQEVAPATGLTASDYAPQGLNYFLPDDSYTAEYSVLPGATLSLGDPTWNRDRQFGVPPITYPDGTTVVGTPIGKFISATVTGSQVEIREFS